MSLRLGHATGLFPLVGQGAVIKNVGIENSILSLTDSDNPGETNRVGYVGALIGYGLKKTTDKTLNIQNCYSGEDVTLTGGRVGLIGGGDYVSGDVINCYSVSLGICYVDSKEAYNRLNLVGPNISNNLNFEACYSIGNMAYSGGTSKTRSNYCAEWILDQLGSKVIKSNMIGASALLNMPLLNTYNAYEPSESYPVLKCFIKDKINLNLWDGTISKNFKSGSGTEADPYIITSGSELALCVNSSGINEVGEQIYYKLANDINLNNTSILDWYTLSNVNNWFAVKLENPSICFQGVLDGNGYIVRGIYVNKNIESSPFVPGTPEETNCFCHLNGKEVKDARARASLLDKVDLSYFDNFLNLAENTMNEIITKAKLIEASINAQSDQLTAQYNTLSYDLSVLNMQLADVDNRTTELSEKHKKYGKSLYSGSIAVGEELNIEIDSSVLEYKIVNVKLKSNATNVLCYVLQTSSSFTICGVSTRTRAIGENASELFNIYISGSISSGKTVITKNSTGNISMLSTGTTVIDCDKPIISIEGII